MLKKRCYAFFLCFMLLMSTTAVHAASTDFPDQIWPVIDRFTAAETAGDIPAAYNAAKELVAIMEPQPDSQARTEFLAGKYEWLMRHAESLGYIDEAIYYINQYIPYGEKMGWTDGLLYAERKLRAITPELSVFSKTPNATPTYYGAKFEPLSGAYYGSVYDDDPRIGSYATEDITPYFPQPGSLYLMYLEFGESLNQPRYQKYLQEAADAGVGIMFAWNTYSSLPDIDSYTSYIHETIDILAQTNLPIFLRFANEMNVGYNGDDAAAYLNSFRVVADYAHTKNNIAVVWSPNDVGNTDRPFEMYYPGDTYVDWIGVSCYVIRYFQGIRDHGADTDELNTYFYAGNYANPIVRMREITDFMRTNGIQKPLMITEGGVTHYVRPEQEDTTAWASVELRKYYGELIRLYPELKAICYFNVQIPEEVNDYALHSNATLNTLYNELVASEDYYLKSFASEAGFAYLPYEGGLVCSPLELSASAYYPGAEELTVRYYLDDTQIGETPYSPYKFTFDPAQYSVGAHTLGVKVFAGSNELLSWQRPIEIQRSVNVTLNGEPVSFPDQQPVVIDGRTLVPARGIFQDMGYTVDWDEASSTATIHNDAHSISVPIGSPTVTLDGQAVEIDVPAQLIGGRTMLPLRAVTELMEGTVSFDETTNTAHIGTGA